MPSARRSGRSCSTACDPLSRCSPSRGRERSGAGGEANVVDASEYTSAAPVAGPPATPRARGAGALPAEMPAAARAHSTRAIARPSSFGRPVVSRRMRIGATSPCTTPLRCAEASTSAMRAPTAIASRQESGCSRISWANDTPETSWVTMYGWPLGSKPKSRGARTSGRTPSREIAGAVVEEPGAGVAFELRAAHRDRDRRARSPSVAWNRCAPGSRTPWRRRQ